MLRHEQVEQVKQLLSVNVSQREISRLTGVSRDSVRRIFKGEWEAMAAHTTDRPPEVRPGGRVARCRECGALVHLPCLACHVRRKQRIVA